MQTNRLCLVSTRNAARPRQRFAQTFPYCQTVAYENLSQQQAPAETLLLGVGAALLSFADNS